MFVWYCSLISLSKVSGMILLRDRCGSEVGGTNASESLRFLAQEMIDTGVGTVSFTELVGDLSKPVVATPLIQPGMCSPGRRFRVAISLKFRSLEASHTLSDTDMIVSWFMSAVRCCEDHERCLKL
jgi:hypothetical protein